MRGNDGGGRGESGQDARGREYSPSEHVHSFRLVGSTRGNLLVGATEDATSPECA